MSKSWGRCCIATIISMVASFAVSLTLIPVLCSFLLNPKVGRPHTDGLLVRGLKALLRGTLLRVGFNFPIPVLALVLIAMVAAFLLYPKMGKDFLPSFREETALIAATSAPGTSLEEMNKISDVIEQQILAVPEVHKVGRRLGRITAVQQVLVAGRAWRATPADVHRLRSADDAGRRRRQADG